MKYNDVLTKGSVTRTGPGKASFLPFLLAGCMFILGCATSEPQLAEKKPKRCHIGQILSCDVKGRGRSKTYSNCRCVSHMEINTGLGNY